MRDFWYELPEGLIAKYPVKKRGESNLLVLDRESGEIEHRRYFNLVEYIREGDVVVLNETRVLNCRTFFISSRGKEVEVFFLEDLGGGVWFGLVGRARDVFEGEVLRGSQGDILIRVGKRRGNGFLISFLRGSSEELFERYGHVPLPPYMRREDVRKDRERYNTVFARLGGSVAAPTASLNLTDEILEGIERRGARVVRVELRVGWGTFQPVREENIEDFRIHEEYLSVSKGVAEVINGRKGRLWAFGTTVARVLESVAYMSDGRYLVREFSGRTGLFIFPGYEWRVVDVLVTNFHMPDSSLILLVSSFGGVENVRRAYAEGIERGYRFLSYGDSMLIGSGLVGS